MPAVSSVWHPERRTGLQRQQRADDGWAGGTGGGCSATGKLEVAGGGDQSGDRDDSIAATSTFRRRTPTGL
jgi:hypothetical protein